MACEGAKPSVLIAEFGVTGAAGGLSFCSKLGGDSFGPGIAFKYGDREASGAPTLWRTKVLDAELCLLRHFHNRKTNSSRTARTAPIVPPMTAPRFIVFFVFPTDPEGPGISTEELELSDVLVAFVGAVERLVGISEEEDEGEVVVDPDG